MTAPGGDHGEEYRAHSDQPRPWQQYPHPPVDPQAPVNYPGRLPPGDYPQYPPPYPPQPPQPPGPPYGYPPPPPGGPIGYGGPPPGYPGPYDPYQAYQANPHQTNGLAVASLVTSIVGATGQLLFLIGV